MFMKKEIFISLGVAAAIMTGCGSSSSPSVQTDSKFGTGYYLDSAVTGVSYKCGTKEGKTGLNGEFTFEKGASCTFTFAGITLREVIADLLKDDKVTIIEDDIKVATFLQTLDKDGDPSNGITIPAEIIAAMSAANIDALPQNADDIKELYAAIKDVPQYDGKEKSMKEANEHLQGTIKEEAEKSDATVAFSLPETLYRPKVDNHGNGFEFEFKTISLNNEKFSYSESELINGAFTPEEDDDDDDDFKLKAGQWVAESDNDTTPFTLSSDNKKVLLTDWNAELYKQSVTDISGRTVVLYGSDEVVTMPSGATKTMIKFIPTADSYYVWNEKDYPTLSDVVKSKCGTNYFTHAKEDSGINGIAFTCGQEAQTSGTLVGVKRDNSTLVSNVGTWEIKKLPDSTIDGLLVTVNPEYNEHSDNRMFAMKDGKVWEGEWEKAGVANIDAWYNKVAMDVFKVKMIDMEADTEPVEVVTALESLLARRAFYTHKGGVNDYLTKMEFNEDATTVIITPLEGPDRASRTQTTRINGNTLTIGSGDAMTYNNGSANYAGFDSSRFYFDQAEAKNYYDGVVPKDITAPVITITGDATINLTVGDAYTDAGATASDNKDGDITSNIAKTGEVNASMAGTYPISYNVSDAAGNDATEVTRTVIVTDGSASTILITEELLKEKTFYLSFVNGDSTVYMRKSFTGLQGGTEQKLVIKNSDGTVLDNILFGMSYELVNGKQKAANFLFTLNSIDGNEWNLTKQISTSNDGNYDKEVDAVWYLTKPDAYPDELLVPITPLMLKGQNFYHSFSADDDGSIGYGKMTFGLDAGAIHMLELDKNKDEISNEIITFGYIIEDEKIKIIRDNDFKWFILHNIDGNIWSMTEEDDDSKDGSIDDVNSINWHLNKPSDYPEFSEPSENFKFTTEWLNSKTLYNIYYESDDDKWELTVFEFTDENLSFYPENNSTDKTTLPYEITDNGKIRYANPWIDEDGKEFAYIEVIEKTNDYIESGGEDLYFFNHQKAKDFVNSH